MRKDLDRKLRFLERKAIENEAAATRLMLDNKDLLAAVREATAEAPHEHVWSEWKGAFATQQYRECQCGIFDYRKILNHDHDWTDWRDRFGAGGKDRQSRYCGRCNRYEYRPIPEPPERPSARETAYGIISRALDDGIEIGTLSYLLGKAGIAFRYDDEP